MINRLVIACLTRVRTHRVFGALAGGVLACIGAVAMLGVMAGAAFAVNARLCPAAEVAPGLCTGEGAYHDPFGLAVDNSGGPKQGDVYVASIGVGGGSSVGRFTENGDPDPFTGANPNINIEKPNFITVPEGGGTVGATGVAVDGSGDFYVLDRVEPTVILKFSPEGELLDTLPVPGSTSSETSIAVDNSKGPSKGDIYVSSEGAKSVIKLNAKGEAVPGSITGLSDPYAVAVSASGAHVFVSNLNGATEEFSETGTPEGSIGEGSTQSVAVDPSNEHIYVVEGDGSFVQEYEPDGKTKVGGAFAGGALSGFNVGMGVSATTHLIYVSDLSGRVEAFGEGAAPPKPETGTAEVTGTTVIFHGKLNPGGAAGPSDYHFNYAEGKACKGGSLAAGGTVAESKDALVEGKAEGLKPKTKYTFCLTAANIFHSAFGEGVEFETEAGKPVIESESASEVMFDSAKVSATINPSGAPTTCVVKYGLVPGEKEVPCSAALGEGTAGVATSVTLTGLEASKEYHYQFIAENPVSAGTPIEGPDQTFTTEALTIPTTEAPSEIGPETAKANGKIKPNVATNYYFAYGPAGGELKEHTTEHELPVGAETSVSDTISGLTPRTGYEVQLVTVTVADKVTIAGGPVAFATKVALPVITNAPPSVTRTTATLSGEVNTEEGPSEYAIQYGTTTAYSSGTTPSVQLEGAATPTVIEHVLLSELKAGTTYHYRIIASNESGTTNGPDATFTTGKPQPPSAFTGEAVNITATTATITAGVNPDGLQTSYVWEVGSEAEPGVISYIPTYGTAGNGSAGVGLSLGLTGLQPGSTYHYRIVAHNEDGTASGADLTFTTSGFSASILAPASVTLIPYTAPIEPPAGKGVVVRSLTRAQKLAKALKQCSKQPKHKRAACVKSAHKHYGPVKNKSSKRSKR